MSFKSTATGESTGYVWTGLDGITRPSKHYEACVKAFTNKEDCEMCATLFHRAYEMGGVALRIENAAERDRLIKYSVKIRQHANKELGAATDRLTDPSRSGERMNVSAARIFIDGSTQMLERFYANNPDFKNPDYVPKVEDVGSCLNAEEQHTANEEYYRRIREALEGNVMKSKGSKIPRESEKLAETTTAKGPGLEEKKETATKTTEQESSFVSGNTQDIENDNADQEPQDDHQIEDISDDDDVHDRQDNDSSEQEVELQKGDELFADEDVDIFASYAVRTNATFPVEPIPNLPSHECPYQLYECEPVETSTHLSSYVEYRKHIMKTLYLLRQHPSSENVEAINDALEAIYDLNVYYLYRGVKRNMFLSLSGSSWTTTILVKRGAVRLIEDQYKIMRYMYKNYSDIALEAPGMQLPKPRRGAESAAFYRDFIKRYYANQDVDQLHFDEDVLRTEDIDFISKQLRGSSIFDACVDVQFLDEGTRRAVMAMSMSCALNGRKVAEKLNDENKKNLQTALVNTTFMTGTGFNATTLTRVGHYGFLAKANKKLCEDFESVYGVSDVWELLTVKNPITNVSADNLQIKRSFATKHPKNDEELKAILTCFSLSGSSQVRTSYAADERTAKM